MRSDTRPGSGAVPGVADLSSWIVGLRPDERVRRRGLDVDRPAGWIEEWEPDADGVARRLLTVFLTNRECPWRCLMCDLWRNTTLETVPVGAIPRQIRVAVESASAVDVVKLYNAGSFFDPRAIPRADFPAVAELMRPFRQVVVECHPRLVGPVIEEFAGRLDGPRLEVALGLETVHPQVLKRLNKGMTVDDFSRAAEWLRKRGVEVRAFVLIKPPFLGDEEAVEWAERSARLAYDAGAGVVSLIPTRLGNGALEDLSRRGLFAEPRLEVIEEAFDRVLALGCGRGFLDLWDLERFGSDEPGFAARKARLEAMNAGQRILPRVNAGR